MTKNITLSIDEDVLLQVRRIAAEKDTSVNAMVRDYLTHLATRQDRVKEAVQRMKEMSADSGMEVGPITWKREDLYDR